MSERERDEITRLIPSDRGRYPARTLRNGKTRLIHTVLEVLLGGLDELEGDELVAALLEPGDDLADEVALNAVRLQSKKRVNRRCSPQRAWI